METQPFTKTNMFDVSNFGLPEMTRCGSELRRVGADASSLEEAAGAVVRYLYDSLRDTERDRPSCALARFFMTLPFGMLGADLKNFAQRVSGLDEPAASMKCLTLLATAGEQPAWNSRHTSAGHKALPLLSEESVMRSPMIAQLITQLGVPVGRLLKPDPDFVVDAEQHSFNVFHVPEAKGSPYIPAQEEFVIPYDVRSVLGFGGLLPSGDLFAVILFSRRHIPRTTANMFRPLALNVKLAILPFVEKRIFA